MTLERAVFAPLERLAGALHPYRWHFLFFALFGTAGFAALAFAGERYWPEHASRVLWYAAPCFATLIAWSWAAFFFVSWYGPHWRPRFLRRIPQEVLDPFAPLRRVWRLFLLLALLFAPALVWLLWLRIPGPA